MTRRRFMGVLAIAVPLASQVELTREWLSYSCVPERGGYETVTLHIGEIPLVCWDGEYRDCRPGERAREQSRFLR